MNRLLKSALIELRRDGVELDPVADLEHILTLDKLACRVTNDSPPGGSSAHLPPTRQIGNVTIRRLSIGSQRFVADVVAEWYPNDIRMQDLAYVYCMTRSACPEILWAMASDRKEFERAVKQWEKHLTVDIDTLRDSVRAFLAAPADDQAPKQARMSPGDCRAALALLGKLCPIPESYRLEVEMAISGLEASDDDDSSCYGTLIEILVREYGQTPEHWMWRVSQQEIATLMDARQEKMDEESRQINGSRDDRMQRAHYAFVTYLQQLRKAKKGAAK